MNMRHPGEVLPGEIDALRTQLAPHLKAPQRSERWAMYRLIVPIVDLANQQLKLTACFEFSQVSGHGTSQSVDIALLDGCAPTAMIEAKGVGRRIGSDQISKYLPRGVRGIVTNGISWILCFNDLSRSLSLCDADSRAIDVEAVSEIVGFIRGTTRPDSNWSKATMYVDAVVKPDKPPKERTAVRRSNEVQSAVSLSHCDELLSGLSRATDNERVFLKCLFTSIRETLGDIPMNFRVSFRSSRVVFWKNEPPTIWKRVGRIELGKEHPDILVSTEIVANASCLNRVKPSDPHDKGPHMRRFRLETEQQSELFGSTLGKVIFS